MSSHVGAVSNYHPPAQIVHTIIKHALRHIPNAQRVLDKLDKKVYNPLGPLKPHELNSSGVEQFSY